MNNTQIAIRRETGDVERQMSLIQASNEVINAMNALRLAYEQVQYYGTGDEIKKLTLRAQASLILTKRPFFTRFKQRD